MNENRVKIILSMFTVIYPWVVGNMTNDSELRGMTLIGAFLFVVAIVDCLEVKRGRNFWRRERRVHRRNVS